MEVGTFIILSRCLPSYEKFLLKYVLQVAAVEYYAVRHLRRVKPVISSRTLWRHVSGLITA